MSIGAKPWEGGGAASVPDASETVKGKIRIATSTEASDGTDDLTAMTPAKVKARIDAALVGGVEYKGDYTGQSLVTAKQGDMYISNGDQTLAGVSLTNNDHIIFNQDAADPVTASMFDKIDNTDQVTSVNGQTGPVSLGIGDLNNVTISGGGADGDFVRYDSGDSRWENVTAASINLSDFNNDLSLSGNQITDVASQTGSTFTATANVIYVVGYTTGTQTITFPDASASTDGDLIGLTSTGTTDYSLDLVSSDGSTNDLLNMSNQTKGGTNGALSLTVKQELILFACDGTRWRQLSRELADVAKTGAYSDLSGTPTLGTAAALDVGTGANNVVQLDGSSRLPAVDGSQLTNLPSGVTDLNGLSDVTITSAASGNLLQHNGSGQFVNVAKSTINVGDFNDDSTYQPLDAQLTDVAGLTPADGAFIVGDGVNFVTESLATARTSLGLGTAATSDTGDFLASTATLNDISDVTITSVSNGQVISYNSTSGEWENSTPSSGGATDLDGLSDVTITSASSGQILRNNGSGQFVNVALSIVDDSSPQLGGALDVNGNAITSASNGNVTINPDGTGDISVGADIIPDADATHTLGDEDNRFITLHSELNGAVQFKARNETGGALTKGQAVYISGVSGDVPLVSLARANSASTMPAHGLLAADVSNNADVQVISFGNLTAYNTTTHSLSLGDTVYVSAATAGALTSSAPAGETNLIQNIGKVVRASATEGIIKVGGAGRSAATPNLNDGKIFLGNASNQAVSTALSSINLTSFNDDLGSTYQPLDPGLTSISGLTTAADKMIYTTASDTYAVTDLTAAGRAILDDADATAQRSTLGLGSAATSDTGDFLASTAGLNNLSDVTITSVSNGQVISYNSTSGEWENSTPSSGGATDLDGLSDVTITSASSGQILRNNGSGQFVNVALSIVDDPTPQLGGDLDVNANEIVSASNNNVVIRPNGTGHVFLGGNTNPAEIRLYCESSDAHYVGFKSAAHADYGTSIVWELPTSDGTANQILETNGSGVLSWVDQAGAGGAPPLTTASPSSTYAITDTSSVYQIYLLTPSADVDVTLPSAASAGSGARYDVKNLSSSYTLTLKGQTGDNIDGVAPTTGIILGTQYESLTVVSDGSDWFII